MLTAELTTKAAVLQVLDELPEERVSEVLDFALFLKAKRQSPPGNQASVLRLRTLPASTLTSLAGLVDWGGDAVVDAERLYD